MELRRGLNREAGHPPLRPYRAFVVNAYRSTHEGLTRAARDNNGSALSLPANQGASPCQPAAKHRHTDQVPRLDAAVADGFVQCNGTRGRGDVAIFVNSHVEFLKGDLHRLGDVLKHPDVGLVGYDPGDV